MRFSIVVPIYKVEKYLDACVDSILNQSYGNFQLILVDDGSPDNCPQMCDHYADKDRRIIVVHQQNSGLSAARNAGMKAAEGNYIMFVDSDDLMCKDALLGLNRVIKKDSIEVLIGNIIHMYPNEEEIVVDNKQFMSADSESILSMCEQYALKRVQLPWRAYQSVYKREVLAKNNLTFDEGIIGAEDCDFFIKLCAFTPTYCLSDIPLVKYRAYREDSIIHSPSFNSVFGQLKVFAEAFKKANMFPQSDLMKQYFADKFVNIIILVNLLENKDNRDKCYNYISEHKHILDYASESEKYKIAKLIWKLFGFKIGSDILLTINKIRK